MIADYAALRALALGLNLPRTEEGLAWGLPCLRAHDKFWTRWSPDLDAPVILAPVAEGAMQRRADPDTFATRPHCAGHPYLPVRAGRIDPGWAAARLTARWRDRAPKHRLRERDAGRERPS